MSVFPDALNQRQKRFCVLYASDRSFFGNGVEAYVEAYQVDKSNQNWYKTACSSASRLLRNDKVITQINKLLEEEGLNDAFVDKQLKFLITQHGDLGLKLGAIKEYNKLKNRIVDKSQVETRPQVIQLVTYHDTIKNT